MKKIYLSLCLAIACLSVFAQSKQSELRPFKVDASIGYAMPAGSGAKGGILVALEPKYAVMDNLSLGLRMEVAVVARFSGYDETGQPLDVNVKASGGYLATADYYLTNMYAFRPFVGGGVGIYTIATAESSSSGSGGASVGSKFGGMIRAGIEAGHFRLGVEYNIVPSSKIEGFDSNGNPAELTSKNGYLGIKVGVCIGGGRK
jgi:outer membrane protein W